jgi:hypothetical protein
VAFTVQREGGGMSGLNVMDAARSTAGRTLRTAVGFEGSGIKDGTPATGGT